MTVSIIIISWCIVSAVPKLIVADEVFASQFGTKTTYFNRPPIEKSISWNHVNIPHDLKVLKIDATLRHGTRFPSLKRASKMEKAAPKFVQLPLNVSNTPTLRRSVQKWVSKFPKDKYNLLSHLGWNEHIHLGKKYFAMMPKLWLDSVKTDRVTILSSSKVRALASARAFLNAVKSMVDGGFETMDFDPEKVTNESNVLDKDKKIKYGPFIVQVDDRLLRFFDNCRKYAETVTKNESSQHEYKAYFRSDIMHQVSKDVHPEIKTPKDVFSIYLLCAFEVANFNDSTWCNFFQERHYPYLDYATDLKHFYKTGYGYGINHEQSCVLLQAIVEQLENESNAITLRFGHAETLIPLVSILGFFNETGKLHANNYHEKIDRKFRTAKIGPFSGNLAIVLYTSRHEPSKKYLSFVLNEYILKPFGLDCYFCEFHPKSVVYREMRRRMQGCDQMCIFTTHETSDAQDPRKRHNEL